MLAVGVRPGDKLFHRPGAGAGLTRTLGHDDLGNRHHIAAFDQREVDAGLSPRGAHGVERLADARLMQDIRVVWAVGAAVADGGFDLLGAGGNHHRFGLAVERRRRVPHDDSVKALVQRIQERLPGAIGWRFDQRQHAAAVAPPLDNFRVLQRYIDGHDVRRALGVFRIRARAGHVLVDLAVPAF